MKVTLLACTPAPEQTVAAAARLCYSPSSIGELQEKMTPERAAGFVDMLSEIGHESPIEHASFTFGIEGVSRSLLAQITRHRIASFSVQSQRYVREVDMEYVTPPQIAENPRAAEIYRQAMAQAQEAYTRLTELLMEGNFQRELAAGRDEKTARRNAEKASIEDARFVLPNACETKMIVTMNARSLHNFFRLRCCSRAQWEIRQVALEMYRLAYEAAPALFRRAGPACVNGACSEGKMSCGRQEEVRKTFEKLREARQ